MIAVDSNVVIYALTGRGEFAEAAREVLVRASAEGATASVLLVGEVLSKTDPELDDQIRQTRDFLENMRNITYQPVTLAIAEEAAELVRGSHSRLRLIDAIHLVSAVSSGATQFWTNDRKLAGAKVPGLSVKLLKGTES